MTPKSTLKSVTICIRDRTAQKANQKVQLLQSSLPIPTLPKLALIVTSDSESDDDLFLDRGKVAAQTAAKPTAKLSPSPEWYSQAEMKSYAKMVKPIRNTSDNAHLTTTANFLDAEFPDNSDRATRVLSSPFT